MEKKVVALLIFGLVVLVMGVILLVQISKSPSSSSASFKSSALVITSNGFQAEENPSSEYQKQTSSQLNVILISVDSLRADHLKSFGYSRDTAPNLEEFINEGTAFHNYITSSYLTPTSEMALHTGQYPTSSGVVSFYSVLSENKTTLAQILKANGYRTAAIGTSPEFEGYPAIRENFQRGFDNYQIEPDRGVPNNIVIKNWIDENTTPFFLWIPIGSVHWPYGKFNPDDDYGQFLDKNYNGYFSDKGNVSWKELRKVYNTSAYTLKEDYPTGEKIPLNKEDFEWVVNQYDGNILQFDDWFKSFSLMLKDLQLENNTLIIITSEHGEDFGEHGYISHYDIFDTQVKTPLIIVGPNIPKNQVIQNQAQSIDVLPTIMDILSILPNSQIQGKSLLSLIEKQPNQDEFNKYVFTERVPLWEQDNVLSFKDPINPGTTKKFMIDNETRFKDVAIRTNEWKLIYRQSRDVQEKYSWGGYISGQSPKIEEYELYDLTKDSLETKNVYSSYPQIAEDLKTRLLKWLEDEERNFPETNLIEYKQDYF